MLELIPEPCAWLALGFLDAAALGRVRGASKATRALAAYVDVALLVTAHDVDEARRCFPRSTHVSVLGTCGAGSLRGLRSVTFLLRGRASVPAIDAPRVAVFAHATTNLTISVSRHLVDLELSSTAFTAQCAAAIAVCTGLHTLRIPNSRVSTFHGLERITALDVSGAKKIPFLALPRLKKLKARGCSMRHGALAGAPMLEFIDVRGARVADYAGIRSLRLVYLDIGDAGLPWPHRGAETQKIDVCLADGAHWLLGPCARYELTTEHVPDVDRWCFDGTLARAF
jgi:hypothetical protein